MMRKRSFTLMLLGVFILFSSCLDTDDYTTDPHTNFEALWKLLDEHYCFFEYKNIDWDGVYEKYSEQVSDTMDRYELFNVLGKMLTELEDGHTNLISTFNTSRFWNWYEGYPDNYNKVVHEKYLGTEYKSAGGITFLIMRDNIGYVYYEDFSTDVGEADLDEMFLYFKDCKALIFDVRNNTGGSLVYSERIASRFLTEKQVVGYIVHKTGCGHNEFSEPYPMELEPSSQAKWLRPVAVLTNRRCYSATNDFVNKMKLFPQVTIIGDKTGGGCGLPFHSDLPNGWGVRYSSSPMLDADKEITEYGVDPDKKVDIKESDQLNHIDTIIEEALDCLKEQASEMTPSVDGDKYINE